MLSVSITDLVLITDHLDYLMINYYKSRGKNKFGQEPCTVGQYSSLLILSAYVVNFKHVNATLLGLDMYLVSI